MMPARVPKPISTRLNTEITKALASTPVKEKLSGFGYELVGGSSE
jgi:tripartite-type tricarboxylate transporter receptor subunit TctC